MDHISNSKSRTKKTLYLIKLIGLLMREKDVQNREKHVFSHTYFVR